MGYNFCIKNIVSLELKDNPFMILEALTLLIACTHASLYSELSNEYSRHSCKEIYI